MVTAPQSRSLTLRNLGVVVAIIAASVTTSLNVPPILPALLQNFASVPRADLLVPLVVGLPPLLSIFSAPLIGLLSDRIGRRQIVLWASLLSGIFGVLPWMLDSLWAILLTRAVMGLCTGALLVCTSALIGDLFHERVRETVLTLKFSALGIAHICAYVLIGHLAAEDWHRAFLIFLWGLPATALVAWFIPRERVAHSSKKPAGIVEEKFRWAEFRYVFLAVFLGLATLHTVVSGVPFLLEEHAIKGTRTAGYAVAGASAGMLVGTAFFPFLSRRLTSDGVWAVVFCLAAFGYAGLGMSDEVAPIMGATLIVGMACGLISPHSLNIIFLRAPAHLRGRIAGLQTTFFFLGMFIGPLIGVSGARALGSSAGLFLAGSALLACVGLLYGFSHRRMRTPDLQVSEEAEPAKTV